MDKFYKELYESIDKELDVNSMIEGLVPFSFKNKECERLFIDGSMNWIFETCDDEECLDIIYTSLKHSLKTIYDKENIEEKCKEKYKENEQKYSAQIALLELLDILKGDKNE